MKGKLLKKKDDWFVEYLEGNEKALMPLYPSELKMRGLSKLKNKEIEFEIEKMYVGFRTIGERENRQHIEMYQNYAKIIK